MFVLAALCLLAGILPGLFIDALAPVAQGLVGAQHAVAERRAWLSIVPIAESRSSYNGLLVFLFMCSPASLAAFVIHRFASDRLRRGAGLGLRLSRPEPGDAIHRVELRPADPPRVRHARVSRARAGRDAAARRHAAGAARRSTCATRSGTRSTRRSPAPSAIVADRLNQLQFLTIRRYLSLVFVALVVLLLVLAIWP